MSNIDEPNKSAIPASATERFNGASYNALLQQISALVEHAKTK